MIQLKVDQGGNTAVDDDHEGNQKNDDRYAKYQKKEDLHRFKAQTAHYVGLYGWATALCEAPAVVERFRVRIWGHRVRASYPERRSCGRRRHDGMRSIWIHRTEAFFLANRFVVESKGRHSAR
jgi:hypothetical protein